LTEWLLPHYKQLMGGVWHSLNFVRAGEVKRAVQGTAFSLSFNRHFFYETLLRLETDLVFAKRHRFPVMLMGWLRRLRLVGLLKWVPYWLVTPMEFVITRR